MKNKIKDHLSDTLPIFIILVLFCTSFIFILARQYTWSGVCDSAIKGCKNVDIDRYCKYYDVKLNDIKHCLK